MKKRRITVKINSTIKFIQLWNGIFNLTSKEIEILAQFIDVNSIKGNDNVCSVDNKKDVAALVGIADYNTLSLYTIDIYDIVVIQDPDGNCISIRIEEFEDPADPLPLDS